MRGGAAFALLALLPVALNAAPLPTGRRLLVPLCSGGTQVIDLPARPGPEPAPAHEDQNCPKACHAGCSRKRAAGGEDPA